MIRIKCISSLVARSIPQIHTQLRPQHCACFHVRLSSTVASGSKVKLLRNQGYVNGKWISSHDGNTFDVLDPGTHEEITSVPDMGPQETEDAIQAAKTAFKSWSKVPARERADMLMRWRESILNNKEDIARLITMEAGKALAESRGEIAYGADFIKWYAEECRRTYGEVVPSPHPSKRVFMLRHPIGVSAQITPWNFPTSMLCRKAAPALAAGCTVVIKPAEDTPLSALALCQLADEVGMPPGVFNVVTASREQAGAVGKTLCESHDVANISFTGSTHVGKILMQQGAETVKRLSMELGGNGPCMVFESADLNRAVHGAFLGKFRNGGQACIGINRILVQDSIYDEFVSGYSKLVSGIKVGYGLDEGVTLGPLVNHRSVTKIEHLVNDAIEKGANLVTGGKLHELGGNYFLPTILTEVTDKMEIFHSEIFGPVASIIRFETEDEAIEMANNTTHGLSSYIYSEDHRQIWRVVEAVESGVVGVNDSAVAIVEGTYGGWKESGLGREGAKFGIDEFLEVKYLCLGGF